MKTGIYLFSAYWAATLLVPVQAAPSIPTVRASIPRNHTTFSNTTTTAHDSARSLPVIDLGYARYRASAYTEEGDFYTFSNIRYAAPPTGARRFGPPEPPLQEDDDVVNDGSYGFMCHQAYNLQFKGLEFVAPADQQSEDCLFLDIYVPACALATTMTASNASAATKALSSDLPVLVWIHGGGFVFGQKDGLMTPHGMMSVADGKMVYVSINYRLGAFGFLAGSEVKERGQTNVGLKDQRAALDWVAAHVSSFGGDAGQVTVMGESAGASSIMHHMTAPAPVQFKRAILQSTAYYPQYDPDLLDSQFKGFAATSGCESDCDKDRFECLMQLDEDKLAQANKDYVYSTRYGTFMFGPYVDREYVPLLPLFRLGYGQFNKDVHVLAGHNKNEGHIFADPTAITDADFANLLVEHFPNATQHTLDEIQALYPRRRLASQRASDIISEWIVGCNLQYLDEYFPNTYLYKFSLPPALHGLDLVLTFWRDVTPKSSSSSSSNTTLSNNAPRTPLSLREHAVETFGRRALFSNWFSELARHWQEWAVSFAVGGDPNYLSTSAVRFPMANEDPDSRAMMEVLRDGEFRVTSLAESGADMGRCGFWMEGDWTGR
ncbi:Carboxylesterase [Myxozyma melibiosi]|uniref:Carboxylic ester hydrolase n=1 Tax=Myxozyma melibiosi TaxID=54550 RepID=A0ABR1F2E5_9ASCO